MAEGSFKRALPVPSLVNDSSHFLLQLRPLHSYDALHGQDLDQAERDPNENRHCLPQSLKNHKTQSWFSKSEISEPFRKEFQLHASARYESPPPPPPPNIQETDQYLRTLKAIPAMAPSAPLNPRLESMGQATVMIWSTVDSISLEGGGGAFFRA